tara:strand:- start:588 stop:1538 length:951 start_codon:yes stop_codon:yes gene_type:complete
MLLGKKFLILIIFFFSHNILFANDFNSLKGEKIFDEFKVNKRMKFDISGEWEAIDKYSDYVGWGIKVEGVTFVQMKNDIPIKFFEIARATGLSKWQAYLTNIIESATFNPKEEGCRERQHYNYLNVYKRGNAHNCMIVTMLDVQRALNPSDYDPDRVFSLGIRKWVEKNEINLPKIYLKYESSFHSMSVRDEWYVMLYAETPQNFANYKPKFSSRDTTEFHPDKISNFPEAKKIMQRWIKESAKLHKNFEIFQKAKKSQKLDLSVYVSSKEKKSQKKIKFSNGNLSEELIKLNELYKSGALTKEEFEKAKKRVLNN